MRSYAGAGLFKIHEFVVMPDHVHILLTLPGSMSIEKAIGMIKGNFLIALKKEFGYALEVWQRGFSEVRVNDRASFLAHHDYIEQNPVKAGLVKQAEDYPYSSVFLRKQKAAAAKAGE